MSVEAVAQSARLRGEEVDIAEHGEATAEHGEASSTVAAAAAVVVAALPIGDGDRSVSLLNKRLSMLAGDAVEVSVGRGGMRMDVHPDRA